LQKRIQTWICGGLAFAFLFVSLQALEGQSTDHGKVSGNTYADGRFGLRYTFPANLDAQSSLNGTPVGTGEKNGTSEFLFSAMEKPNGRVREGIFITSDPVGAGGIRETQQFLRLVIANGMGVKPPTEFIKVAIAGRDFYQSRVNIPGAITIYGAQLATICSGHFLVFWFSAPSPSELEAMIHSLDGMSLTCSLAAR
jgi:hypothetical protein